MVISVCIATYNGEKYIKEQIQSILKQLDKNDEIVVSDDNSTDKTIEILKAINDTRIKFFKNSVKGYVSNFENALKNASGDIIFLSDQDDIWKENKVEVTLDYLKTYDFVVSDCEIIDVDGRIISNSFFKNRRISKTIIGNVVKFGFLGCCIAFKKNVLTKALPFPKNRRYCTHDNWLFLVGSIFYKYKVIDERLIFYRRHINNTSTGGMINNNSLRFMISYRLYLLFNIFYLFINSRNKK